LSPLGKGTAIVGIGETQVGQLTDRTSLDLQAEAVLLAVADAGLDIGEVDGLFNQSPMTAPTPLYAMALGEYLRIHPGIQGSVDAGGTWSMMLMLLNCLWGVQSGMCSVAVGAFGERAATGRPVAGRGFTTPAGWPEYEAPFGLSGAVTPYALLTVRHMSEFGTTSDGLCAVAMSARKHASMNENAFRRDQLTKEDYFKSRMVSSPLRLLDCASIVDGAGAFVVTTTDRARNLRNRPVEVLSAASHLSHRNVGEYTTFADLRLAETARRALEKAGVTIDDVDVAAVHDAITISTLIYIEAMGLCGVGEGGPYASEGGLDLGGPCPVNTHGGLLSQGHVGGILHLVELVRQLRWESGHRQVQGAELGVLAGGGGMLGNNAFTVLARSR
jgi:acetyl-CoA acetyltransferase